MELRAAIEVFDAGWFDVVIATLNLPGMSGNQFAKVHQRTRWGNADHSSDWPSPRPNARWYLNKPFDLESLRRALLAVCGQSAAR